MKGFAAVILAAGCLFLMACACLADDGNDLPGPQTIADIKSLPDFTHVSLCLEDIVKIEPNIVIAEPFSRKDRLVILASPSPSLRLTQVIDCQGDLVTLPNGDRALQNVQILGYATQSGELVYHPDLVKGFPLQLPWSGTMIDLTITSTSNANRTSRGIMRGASLNRALDDNPPPDNDPPDTTDPGPVYYDSVDSAINALLINGSLVAFECEWIAGSGTDTINGIDYNYIDIVDSSGSCTLRAYYDATIYSTAATSSFLSSISGQLQDNGSGLQVLDINSGPNYDPQLYVGDLQDMGPIDYSSNPPVMPNIATAVMQQNGTSLQVSGIVSATNMDMPGYLYIQSPSTSGIPFSATGIRIQGTSSALRGNTVNVSGTIQSGNDGEREIDGATISVTSTSTTVPKPVGISCTALGGNLSNKNVIAITSPPSYGCYNRGLLCKIWGKVTCISTNYFYLDDGSGLQDGSGYTGVKVSWAWPVGKTPISLPQVGWFVSVTGVSGSEKNSQGNYLRVLRPRDPRDIIALNTNDNSLPSIAITMPVDGQLNLAQGQSIVQLSGTASDPDTGISCVEMAVVPSGSTKPVHPWSFATYSSAAHTWAYNWTNAVSGSYTIYASATDFAGHTTEVSRNVTVNNASVIYVSPNGNNSNNGRSWSVPKAMLSGTQGALSIANSGDEIWVAQGTYSTVLTMKANVGLYGGFAGTEHVREQRNWATNKTILDGGGQGPIVYIGVTGCTLDGFIIQNGTGNYDGNGGGIYCNYASARIANNIVRHNSCEGASNNPFGLGGGLYSYYSTLTMVDNVFLDNDAYTGGGAMFCAVTTGQIGIVPFIVES